MSETHTLFVWEMPCQSHHTADQPCPLCLEKAEKSQWTFFEQWWDSKKVKSEYLKSWFKQHLLQNGFDLNKRDFQEIQSLWEEWCDINTLAGECE